MICTRYSRYRELVLGHSGGWGASSRARHTGAGEHHLGATLAAGGAATGAAVGGRDVQQTVN